MRYRYPAYVGAGVAASALAALLGYAQKLPCSSGGAWNSFTGQFRDACYTDIYPLYYNEGLSAGKVPYFGHPVEYPVLIGAMMQAAAWAVHSVTDPYSRGKDFYYVTVVLLAICLVAGVLATAATAHREGDGAGWKAALLVALSPALILAAFINWDLFAMALAAGGLAAWAAERQYLAGVLLGLAVATKFYPLLFFGALLLLCLRAGRMREFGKAFGAGLLAWLVVNLPVAITRDGQLGSVLRVQPGPGRRLGIGLVPVRALQRPGARRLLAERAEPDVIGRLRPRVRRHRVPGAGRAAPAPAAAAVLPAAGRVPDPEQGLVAAVRDLAGAAGGAGQAAGLAVRDLAVGRGRLLLRHLGLLREHVPGAAGVTVGWYFVILAARLLSVGLVAGTIVHDIVRPERDRVRASGLNDDPAGGVLDGAPDRLVIVWGRDARQPAEAAAKQL